MHTIQQLDDNKWFVLGSVQSTTGLNVADPVASG